MTKHSDTASQPNLEVLTMEHGFVAHIFSFPVRKAELLTQEPLNFSPKATPPGPPQREEVHAWLYGPTAWRTEHWVSPIKMHSTRSKIFVPLQDRERDKPDVTSVTSEERRAFHLPLKESISHAAKRIWEHAYLEIDSGGRRIPRRHPGLPRCQSHDAAAFRQL